MAATAVMIGDAVGRGVGVAWGVWVSVGVGVAAQAMRASAVNAMAVGMYSVGKRVGSADVDKMFAHPLESVRAREAKIAK